MAQQATFKLIGGAQLRAELEAMAGAPGRAVMRGAVRDALKVIETEARSRAPGKTIRRMIGRKVWTKGLAVRGKVYVKPNPGRTVSFDGRELPFEFVANVLEFGSSSRGIRPRAFMRGARETKRAEALRELDRSAQARLEMAWKRRGNGKFWA